MPVKTVILIGGPTASGKSRLAEALATVAGGRIINADAMQVYAGLPILTSLPSQATQQRLPHRLYGHIDLAERYSVGKWLQAVKAEMDEANRAGETPVIVGGTGLYFKALTQGLANIPDIPEHMRKQAQALYHQLGGLKFRERLRALDAVSAERLNVSDPQRLIRAYEVATHTGKPLSQWQAETAKTSLSDTDWQPYVVMPPREKLYEVCDRRFEQMLQHGAIDEVKTLLARKLDPELPAMKILGVAEIGDYLASKISLEEAKTKAQQLTRNYAKRQVTWFKNQWLNKPSFTRTVKIIETLVDHNATGQCLQTIAT